MECLIPQPADPASNRRDYDLAVCRMNKHIKMISAALHSYGMSPSLDHVKLFEYGMPASRLWACETARKALDIYVKPGLVILLSSLEDIDGESIKYALGLLEHGMLIMGEVGDTLSSVPPIDKTASSSRRPTNIDYWKGEARALQEWFDSISSAAGK